MVTRRPMQGGNPLATWWMARGITFYGPSMSWLTPRRSAAAFHNSCSMRAERAGRLPSLAAGSSASLGRPYAITPNGHQASSDQDPRYQQVGAWPGTDRHDRRSARCAMNRGGDKGKYRREKRPKRRNPDRARPARAPATKRPYEQHRDRSRARGDEHRQEHVEDNASPRDNISLTMCCVAPEGEEQDRQGDKYSQADEARTSQ